MPSIDIELSDHEFNWLSKRARAEGFDDERDFVNNVVRDTLREIQREEFEDSLRKAYESSSTVLTDEAWEEMKDKARAMAEERRKEIEASKRTA